MNIVDALIIFWKFSVRLTIVWKLLLEKLSSGNCGSIDHLLEIYGWINHRLEISFGLIIV